MLLIYHILIIYLAIVAYIFTKLLYHDLREQWDELQYKLSPSQKDNQNIIKSICLLLIGANNSYKNIPHTFIKYLLFLAFATIMPIIMAHLEIVDLTSKHN